jgi:3-oxoacyl-[acyl-carrier protein] reductase
MSNHEADNSIKGKLCLITGASGGIGAAIARQLILQDVDLALHYSSNLLAIEEVVAQLRHEHDVQRPDAGYLRITTHQADLGVSEQVIGLVEEVREAHGRGVDILVSNAGRGKRITDIWDIPLEEFEKTITINLTASFLLVKGVVEHMKQKHWGRIIFMSSIAASGVGINGCRKCILSGPSYSPLRPLQPHSTVLI